MKSLDVQRRFRFRLGDLGRLFLLVGFVGVALANVPNQIYDAATGRIVVTLGVLGVWRYGWWLTHLVRAQVYARFVFPRWRRKAERLWQEGWRPRRIFYMVTTFRERQETTKKVLASIVQECRSSGIPARIFFGTSDASDEEVIEAYLRRHAQDADIDLWFVRQNVPGKRVAIGLALRAMSRYGVADEDLVVFLDGDTYLKPGLLRKCLPLFALRPRLDALTTDEQVVVRGPRWMQSWLEMRLAQRHLAMQSHALAGKVLTLTGRLSIYRARDVVREDFIRLVEADHLDHWLWGRFRFLSGDDKSTVYALLRKPGGTELTYVPDAVACTIEQVEGSGLARMRQNLLRWSGNLLRNGRRCLALGPRQLGFFIWWCILDQRIAMWTTLVGPLAALLLTVLGGPVYLAAALLWVLTTRLLLSLVLFAYAGRIDVNYPWLLYLNQVLNAAVKVYMVFRLAKQRWRNRGDQRSAEGAGVLVRYQTLMSSYLTGLYVGAFAFGMVLFFLCVDLPRWNVVLEAIGRR